MTDNGTPEDSTTEEIRLPEEHPAIAPLSFLLGRWRGTGKGDYPTIKSFDFAQEITFSHIGKPYLIYTSRSWRLATDDKGELVRDTRGAPVRLEPLAVETGFWRPAPEGKVEVLLTHPTGITEIYAGELRGMTSIELVTDAVARTATAKPYTAGKRLYGLVPSQTREGENDLAYAFDMAAMGHPLTPHLWAVLSWEWIALPGVSSRWRPRTPSEIKEPPGDSASRRARDQLDKAGQPGGPVIA